MAKRTPKVVSSADSKPLMRSGLTPEAEEKQMIALATNLVKQRLIDGTASSQETTHFLKLATTESRLKNQLLEAQSELAAAKRDAIRRDEHRNELFAEAIAAMKKYSGNGGSDED